MIKKVLVVVVFLFLITPFFRIGLFAKLIEYPQYPSDGLPESPGIYSVPGKPYLNLRVFSHPGRNNNPGKSNKPSPTPTPTPVLSCDLRDPNSATVSSTTGWHLPTSFSFLLNTESTPLSVGSENMSTIVNNSFSQWTSAINGFVTLNDSGTTIKTRARLDGENIIAWGRASSGTLGITYTWYYTSSHEVAEVDTIMNKAYPWSWSNPASWDGNICAYSQSYDAQNIITHELGHWFGVNDDYEDWFIDNTMYGYGSMQETKKDTLTDGDVSAVQSIYPQ